MSKKSKTPDEWWSETVTADRKSYMDVMRFAEDLLDGEALRITFDGQKFSAGFASARDPFLQPGRSGGRVKVAPPEPDVWWSGLRTGMRGFVQELAEIIACVKRDRNEEVELKHTGGVLSAKLNLKLKNPTGGNSRFN